MIDLYIFGALLALSICVPLIGYIYAVKRQTAHNQQQIREVRAITSRLDARMKARSTN